MKHFLLLIFCISFIIGKAQTVKLFHERKEQGFIIYATNSEICPVSVSIDLNALNLTFSEGQKTIFVIPAKSEKYKIGELTTTEKGQKTKFNYKYKTALGDVTNTNLDKSFVYDLPFQKGKSFNVYQGYNGTFSHQNENSIDFTMPEGTEVLAARDGIVVQLVLTNTESCSEKECAKFNNYITIMHSDGSFASYLHIKYNGSNLKLGDEVKKGTIIAYSGNVGWTSGPHLHFVCFLDGFDTKNTIETKFRINKGTETAFLKEGDNYLRDY